MSSGLSPRISSMKLDGQSEVGQPITQPRHSTPSPPAHSFTPQGVQFSKSGRMVIYKPLKPSPLISLPPMPPSVKTAKRFYFYGWHFPPQWLQNLARGQPGVRSIFSYEWTNTDGVLFIARYTGYPHVHIMGGVAEDDTIYEGATWEDGKQIIDIISIYVNHRKLRHRRPTEEQMQRLIHIFGREPSWYQDCNPPEYFSSSYDGQDMASFMKLPI